MFRSMWADRNGTHMTPMDKGAIDTVCIYCPETDECYYVRPDAHGASVTLRIAPSRNGQQAGVAGRSRIPRAAARSSPLTSAGVVGHEPCAESRRLSQMTPSRRPNFAMNDSAP